MTQTGDPTGTGKGGQSIWGKKFEDEVRDDLKVRNCNGDECVLSLSSLIYFAYFGNDSLM